MNSSPGFSKRALSRRSFLQKTGLALGAALAFPDIIPARALGLNNTVSPSNRIVLGALGMGQGHFNMSRFLDMADVQVVAVCDLDRKNRERGMKTVNDKYSNQDARGYSDFREMFAKEKLDAAVLAAPDHWHGVHSVTAARAGINIFGEKPLAHTLAEGRAICEAVRANDVVWQTGSWQRSVPNFRQAVELVRNGRIGKITRVDVGLPARFDRGQVKPPRARKENEPIPDGLDYDLWVGPSPWHDYDSRITHYNWRWNLKFGGGNLMDWIGHHLDIAHWAMDLDRTGPVKVTGTGDYGEDEAWDAEYRFNCVCTYANDLVITIGSEIKGGATFHGEKGWIRVDRGVLEASDPKILLESTRDDEIHVYRSDNHWRNFIDCIKDRRTTVTPCETAHRSASVGHLGHIAIRTGRAITWDPVAEKIVNDPGATDLLTPKFRAPWNFADIAPKAGK
ncbi:MAG: Gfo/Idh/MocA family oxidoreductase [Puniceicoccales bacterium]|jgi:predicted dehydrogenase|nr:Gfo/Idh/MocA family oxidoreductase [Puniceicoccales bacterium]